MYLLVMCFRVNRFQSASGGWLCETGEVCLGLHPQLSAVLQHPCRSNCSGAAVDHTASSIPQWDYRYNGLPHDVVHPVHPNDMSIMTYRGHLVLQTLIRCNFSPAATTGHKYIYSGSHDGGVYIYDALTGVSRESPEG